MPPSAYTLYKYEMINSCCVFVTATVITPLQIQLSSGSYTALESSGKVCINVMSDRQTSRPFSVSLVPLGMLLYHSASGKSMQ